MLWVFWLLTAIWLLVTAHDLFVVCRLPKLPARAPGSGSRSPSVTVVMAVRDDVADIEASVRRLLDQQQVDLRVLVVDDRSTDGTGEVLAALAKADPRLTVVTVASLPPDWLGKSHALHQGAQNVATPWLLFTDADAQLAADTLARTIAAAEEVGADHVSLLPTHRGATAAGKACLLAFHQTILRRVAAVNSRRQRGFVGTGAFNLVRTAAYRAIGGHLPLRLEVVDDVWLGCLLFRAGYRTRVWLAPEHVAIDWGGTPRHLVRVTTKNMFAVLRYRTLVAAAAVLVTTSLLVASLAAPLLFGERGWLLVAAYGGSALPMAVFAHRLGWSPAVAALVPIGRFLLPIALLHSLWVTLRDGGVRWRGTFYPLAQLRRGQVG